MKLSSVRKKYTIDSHHSIAPSETVLTATKRLKESGLDVFDALEDITEFGGVPIPVFRPSSAHGGNEWGKGLLPDQSKASALMERIERYSSVVASETLKSRLMFARKDAIKTRSMCFDELTPCNLHLFLLRNLSNADNKELIWTESYSLTRKEAVYLPASRVFLAFQQPSVPDFTCSNGLSASNTIEEAIVQGLSEIIERHVYHLFYLNGHREAPRIDLSSVKGELLAKAISDLEDLGYVIIANDHSAGMPLPTISVLMFKPDHSLEFTSPGCYVHFGAAPDPEIALIRCITESVQSMAVAKYRKNYVDASSNSLPAIVEDELMWRLQQQSMRQLYSLPNCAADDFRDEIDFLIAELESMGHEVLVSDLTHPSIRMPVVRVVCPGLQPNFLLLNRSITGFKTCVSQYVEAQNVVHEEAKNGRFYEQHVFHVSG